MAEVIRLWISIVWRLVAGLSGGWVAGGWRKREETSDRIDSITRFA